MKKRRTEHNNFAGLANSSKKAIFALLIIAAALTVYSFVEAAVVSHTPSAIQPQGAAGGFDAATLNGLSSAAILASAATAGTQTASNLAVAGAGWYRVAQISGNSGRGQNTVTIYTNGGSYAPRSTTIRWYKDWATGGGISVISEVGTPTYWTDARVTYDGSATSYLEIYFTQALSINLLSTMQYDGGQTAGSLLTGTLPAGGGTVIATSKLELFAIGSGKFFIDDIGRVGIGTTSPGEKLEITGNLRFSSGATRIIDAPSSATIAIRPDGNLELGTAFTDNVWIGRTDAASSTIFYGGTAGAEVMRLTSGKVGIGTTDPKSALDVNGGVRIGRFTAKPTCDANTIGMLVFDTTVLDRPFVCSNSGWKPVANTDPNGYTTGPGTSGACAFPNPRTSACTCASPDVPTLSSQYLVSPIYSYTTGPSGCAFPNSQTLACTCQSPTSAVLDYQYYVGCCSVFSVYKCHYVGDDLYRVYNCYPPP